MRGPLLSGPIGSSATLDRVAKIVRERSPTVVLSALWLAETMARETGVAVVLEDDKRRAARRAVQRSANSGSRLLIVTAGADVPIRIGSVGSLLVESLVEIENDSEAADYLADLVPALRSDGLLISIDGTKNQATEARLAGLFMAAGLTRIVQERPREGAVLTMGAAPPLAVLRAGLRGLNRRPSTPRRAE